MSEEQTNRGHRVSKAGGKVNKKKKEALEKEETGKIQQMKKENFKMLELFNNSSAELTSVES